LTDIDRLISDYYAQRPEPDNPQQLVSFGTSGHRGTSTDGTFTELHIAAITQAICEYRQQAGYTGPLYLGKDTHALSTPAQQTALEVLVANSIPTVIQQADGFTPTPVISRQILSYNRGRDREFSDGIVITPSHNPPTDGGFKYNPPHGGPADTDVTNWIQDRANQLLRDPSGIRRQHLAGTDVAGLTVTDLIGPYVDDLASVIDFQAIHSAGLTIGVDPLGGAAVAYWVPIQERYGIRLTVVNERVDPQFAFMPLDHDRKIRMDCSSPFAMATLVQMKDQYDIAFGTDPDADRHGIVTRSVGLLNPNHYLAVAIDYLFTHRPAWSPRLSVGKTAVSSGIIDRVAGDLGRPVVEVPVGFKWFVDGLFSGQFGFAGEESAGASFLRHDGTVWTTDKDGLILGLLAAEITARTGTDPGELFHSLAQRFGQPFYRRIDQTATAREKSILKKLSPELVQADTLAGDPILDKQTRAPGNQASLGGLKVVTAHGWFAARPSGTEDIYKIYAESFRDETHLQRVIDEAREIVAAAFAAAKTA
jgi:phosphoglucomutase